MKGGYFIRRTKGQLASQHGGFTIVETLIVLAVTMAIFLSVVGLISGRQAKTEFTQAANDIQNNIQQTISEVATNYYPNNGQFKCDRGPSGPVITGGNRGQGTNDACIFLGKVIQFGVSTDITSYNTYTIAGLRLKVGLPVANASESKSYNEAAPIAIARGTGSPSTMPDPFVSSHLKNGLTPVHMRYYSASGPTEITAVGFLTSLGTFDSSGSLESGSQQLSLIPIIFSPPATVGNKSGPQVVDRIATKLGQAVTTTNSADWFVQHPPQRVTICFKSGGTGQYALITIGGANGRALTTQLTIYGGTAPAECS